MLRRLQIGRTSWATSLRLCLAALAVAAWPSYSTPHQQAPQAPGVPQGPTPPGGTQESSVAKAVLTTVEKLFTNKPGSLLVQSIVPGGGAGGGGHYIKDFSRDPWEREFRATSVASIRAFWMAELQVRLAHEAFSPWKSEEDKFNMHFFVRTRDLPKMAFYGIGTNPNPAPVAYFRERNTLSGIDATNPLVSWLAVGGRLEELWPLAEAAGPAAQSIAVLYPGTPGLASQPSFTHYEIFLRPRFPARPPFNIDYKVAYGYFQDHNTGQFSFRRLTVNAYNNLYPFHLPDHSTNADRFFTLRGFIVASDTSTGHVVPFYLQPTLGGTDANNDATLRGFSDYQFRGPNAILMQAEYNHRFWKYLGGFVFYDAGKVTLLKSDLNFSNLRQSYGFGVSFWMNDLVLFKVYVGLGSGKGPHPYFGIPNFTGENLVTGRGPAATPWD